MSIRLLYSAIKNQRKSEAVTDEQQDHCLLFINKQNIFLYDNKHKSRTVFVHQWENRGGLLALCGFPGSVKNFKRQMNELTRLPDLFTYLTPSSVLYIPVSVQKADSVVQLRVVCYGVD